MITSKQNSKIKSIRNLQNSSRARSESQRFAVEGVRLAEEAVAADWPILSGIYSDEVSERGRALIGQIENMNVAMELCSNEVLKSASDTQNPQGLTLIVAHKKLDRPRKPDFVLVLDAIQNPGNMGSLLRSALGAGIEALILGPHCVDAYSPKVLRSAMGAQFRLPMQKMNWGEIREMSSDLGIKVFISEMDEGISYSEADYEGPTMLVLGNEAEGVGREAREIASESISIPMNDDLESLNAAAAGAILLFEIARQKSLKEKQ